MQQSQNFLDFIPDYMLHYDNESCYSSDWRQLWSEWQSTDPLENLYVCKASYHMTGENHQVVKGLAALPPSKFNFVADVLCVAVACDVKLVKPASPMDW